MRRGQENTRITKHTDPLSTSSSKDGPRHHKIIQTLLEGLGKQGGVGET